MVFKNIGSKTATAAEKNGLSVHFFPEDTSDRQKVLDHALELQADEYNEDIIDFVEISIDVYEDDDEEISIFYKGFPIISLDCLGTVYPTCFLRLYFDLFYDEATTKKFINEFARLIASDYITYDEALEVIRIIKTAIYEAGIMCGVDISGADSFVANLINDEDFEVQIEGEEQYLFKRNTYLNALKALKVFGLTVLPTRNDDTFTVVIPSDDDE